MKILSVVVTYNRKDLLQECIIALKNQKRIKTDILIIDNASNDGTEEMIEEKFIDDVIYQNTGANLGGAGGFNYGIKKSFDLHKKYDYLWVMDDDTIPKDDTLYEISKIVEKDKNFGFISPKTLWIDGSLCLMNKQRKIDNNQIDLDTLDMTKLLSASFVGCFLNVKAVIDVGLPIKEFFIWGDDVEYTKRISKKYNCYFTNSGELLHKMKSNLPTNIESEQLERIDRYFYHYRNRFYIAKKEGLKKIASYHFNVLKSIVKVLIRSKNYKLKRISTIFKGYIQGIVFNPKIEYIN